MFAIDPDIRRAHTLPGAFYTEPGYFQQAREQIFARSWQIIPGAAETVRLPFDALPFRYLPGYMEEPLLLLRDQDNQLQCLSNVCTHRGKILVEQPCKLPHGIQCSYHGRRFKCNGQFQSMPETEGMENFPSTSDHLTPLQVQAWRSFAFTSLAPEIPFQEWIAPMEDRIGFLPVEQFLFAPERSRDYLVKANWALYVDNYLEGFHIPFVHKSLHESLDWSAYRTELFAWSNVQVGISKGGEHVFDLPQQHPDFGQAVAAYYFWLFPNLMFNFYPWGLSLNIILPLAPGLTKVQFRSFIWDASKLDTGAGADVDRVEREDEAVVEQVQMGLGSRFYTQGRYSPKQERGVHHFHCLVDKMMSRPISEAAY